jgi:hypothetical protein
MRNVIFACFVAINAIATTGSELYLDLMKKVLANTIYEDPSFAGPYYADRRMIGTDHPTVAHTMIGMKRLNNIHECLEEILQNKIPGDCIETGVWRGGATILMRAILKAYGDETRKVWVADSFEGLPPPNAEKYPKDRGADLYKISYLAVSLDEVQSNFQKYGLLDDQVVFLKGFFRDTLPTAPIERLALLRLDGDLYESTIEALEFLYPKLSVGGFVIIDDYASNTTCKLAVHDYRNKYQINEPMIWIDGDAVYWKKVK